MKQSKYDPTNKYIQCYCHKKQMILLGWGIYFYGNIFALVGTALFCTVVLFVGLVDPHALIPFGMLALILFVTRISYKEYFNIMIKEGHTQACSKRVALKGAWHQGMYAPEFKTNIDPKGVCPQGDYATPIIGLWMVSAMVNWAFVWQSSYDESVSFLYPIMFVIAMVLSIAILMRIKRMQGILVTVCILNVLASGFFLSIYLIDTVLGI